MNSTVSITDINGTWEGIQFGYYLLDIKANGEGYLVFTLENESDENYQIVDVNLSQSPCFITFKNLGKDNELIKVNITLLGQNILILSELNNDSGKENEHLFLLRESIVPKLKKKAKETIKQIEKPRVMIESGV